MCGLSGVAGDVTNKEERAFKDLLLMSQVRGQDSTGVGSVSRNNSNGKREIKIAKELGPPIYLFDTKSFDKCFYGTNNCYIGHNRSRTQGEITRKNAHPFLFENILGAHNGTLDYQNKNRLECGSEFKTDSEAIFNNIEVHGIEDTIGRIEKSESYALTWYDRKDNSINLLRNEHRPLWYIYSPDHTCIFWASEYYILMSALSAERRNIDIKNEKPFLATPDIHYKWIIPETYMKKLPEPIRQKLDNIKITYAAPSWAQGKKQGNTGANSFSTTSNGLAPGVDCGYDPEEFELWNNQDAGEDTTVGSSGGVLGLVKDALSLVSGNVEGDNTKQGPVTKIANTKIMTSNEVFRRKQLENLHLQGQIKPNAVMPLVYAGNNLVVHYDNETNTWKTFRWNPGAGIWNTFNTPKPPGDIPFTLLDINSRHQFEHQGRKKKKRILYKGYRGTLLGQDQFTKAMQKGCVNCDRKPEWGHEVEFLDGTHSFLCEHCAKVPAIKNAVKTKIEITHQADVG